MENEKDKELPSGWVEIDFADSCHKISLNGIKVKEKEYKESGLFPTVDQGQKLIGGYFDDPFLVVPMEPPYIIFGDHTKVKKFINFRFIAGGDGLKVLKAKEFFNPWLIYYFMHVIKLPDKGYARHFQYLEKSKIPIPPLAEQHRIVAKLEELFSELDKGVENLRLAQQQLKVYRQAVLQWAFEGKLTEEWRRKNSEKLQLLRCVETVGCNEEKMELPSEWRLTNLSSVGEAIDPHPSHRTPPVVENGIPYVGIAECDYKKYAIDFDSARKVSTDVLKEHTARYLINKDDFIIGKIGTIGKPFKVPSERFFALSANVVLVQPDRILINADYVFYLFQSQVIEKQFSQGLKATTQAAFGIQKVRLMKIPYCSLPEQHQIVAEIESRLSVCDKLEETIAQSLLQAEALRQSILKQAFAGKLVPQDPSDEPVEKLLARIRAERAAANPDKIKSAKRKVK